MSQQHLVSIRNYLQQASTEMENRIASNPVPSSTQPVPPLLQQLIQHPLQLIRQRTHPCLLQWILTKG